MGFFDGLDAEAYDRTYRDRDLVRRMAGYFRPHTRRLAGAALATLVISGAGAATPLLIARGVDWMTALGTTSAMFALAGAPFFPPGGGLLWGGGRGARPPPPPP